MIDETSADGVPPLYMFHASTGNARGKHPRPTHQSNFKWCMMKCMSGFDENAADKLKKLNSKCQKKGKLLRQFNNSYKENLKIC